MTLEELYRAMDKLDATYSDLREMGVSSYVLGTMKDAMANLNWEIQEAIEEAREDDWGAKVDFEREKNK